MILVQFNDVQFEQLNLKVSTIDRRYHLQGDYETGQIINSLQTALLLLIFK